MIHSSSTAMYIGVLVMLRCPRRPTASARCPRPKQPVVLYEFEGCPFCRKVRGLLQSVASSQKLVGTSPSMEARSCRLGMPARKCLPVTLHPCCPARGRGRGQTSMPCHAA